MARLRDIRERVHQPKYDTLVKGIAVTNIAATSRLFGNANVGQQDLTNLQQPGQLSSDATYVLKAMRCAMYFQGLNDAEFSNAYGTLPALTTIGTNARAEDLYSIMAYSTIFTLNVGNKPMLIAPLWYIPAGGGITGFTTENSRHALTNGVASQEAILRLAKDIPITVRQAFDVEIRIYPYVRLNGGLNTAGAAIGGDVDTQGCLNQFDGIKLVQLHLDGVETRDVQ
jgi:hypothetical protein